MPKIIGGRQVPTPAPQPAPAPLSGKPGGRGLSAINLPAKAAEVKAEAQAKTDSFVDTLAAVLWKYGQDISTPAVQGALRKVGIDQAQISPATLHRALEQNSNRLWDSFKETNGVAASWAKQLGGATAAHHSRLVIVVIGDGTLDPALNPDHPIKGAAWMKREQERREALSRGSSTERDAATQAVLNVTRTPAGVEPEAKHSEGGKKYDLLGFPVTAVCRWMGREGWSAEEALLVLQDYGIECSESTVKIQVRAGAKGQRGDPANLTEAQAATLTHKKDILAGHKPERL